MSYTRFVSKFLIISAAFMLFSIVYADTGLVIDQLSKGAVLSQLKAGSFRSFPFKVKSYPKFLDGKLSVYIPRGNGKEPGKEFSFRVNMPVTVYAFVNIRGGFRLEDWNRISDRADWLVNDRVYQDIIYKKDFKAGKVIIPEHTGKTGTGVYGVGHLAVIVPQTEKVQTSLQISKISDGAMVSNFPSRIIMGNVSMVTPSDIFDNAIYISAPRGNSRKPGTGFSFYINQDSDIYLTVQKRGNPNIPSDWKKTQYVSYWRHSNNLHEDEVYQKHFKAGLVEIPPNNGYNGNIYAIPNAAIILQPSKNNKLYKWADIKTITDSTVEYKFAFNLPPGKLENGKVYLFGFYINSPKNSVVRLNISPDQTMPFGNDERTEGIWEKIYFPFMTTAGSAEKVIKFTLTLPPHTQIKAPYIDKDRDGILPHKNQIVKYFPGKEWKSVNMGRGNEYFKSIKPGSALDFSKIADRVPSGNKGFLTINSDGELVFENDSEKTVSFRSCGFPIQNCRTTKDIDEYVSLLCLQGYNMVRLHGGLESLAKNKYCKFGVTIDKATFIPQSKDDFEEFFDKKKLKLFDYFLDQFGKHGIYIYMDAMTRFTGFTDATQAGHWIGKDLLGQQFHAQLYVNPTFRQNWKGAISYILNHTNSYNGRKIKDDPVIACILFMNEQNFRLTPSYLSAFEPEWQKFYGNKAPKLTEKLLKSDSEDGRKAGKFMLEKIEDMTKFFRDSIREAGYKGLVSNWDLYMRMIDAPGREMLQVTSMHSYHGHPGLPRTDPSVPGYNVSTAYGKKEININRKSSIKENGTFLSRIMAMQHIGRPSMFMEYGDTAPNPYRHEAGLFVASYSKLNGVDVLMPHGRIFCDEFTPITPYSYSSYSDPIFRASDVINVFAFLRGDVKTGKHNVEFLVTPKILESANRIDALAGEYAQTFLLTKIGMRYTAGKALDKVGNVNPDLEITPKVFARARGTSVEAVTTDYEENRPDIIKEIVDQLRRKNILNKQNRTDVDKKIFESETNELLFMPEKGTMLVNTPRLEGAVVKENKAVKLNLLSIDNCSTPAAVSMISLDKDQSLKESKHLILVFSTNAVNFGMVTNAEGDRILKTGMAPILMKNGKLSVRLTNNQKNIPTVYALNLDGSRAEKIEAKQDSKGLNISLDTSKLKYATPFFEVIY